jgi:hypothetical protein
MLYDPLRIKIGNLVLRHKMYPQCDIDNRGFWNTRRRTYHVIQIELPFWLLDIQRPELFGVLDVQQPNEQPRTEFVPTVKHRAAINMTSRVHEYRSVLA